MRIPLVDLRAQYERIKPDVDAAIQGVIDSTDFTLGQAVDDFEEAFARAVGAKGAVGVASGTSALNLALRAVGVGPGDEVITTALTFIATAGAISHTGATPVFVDVDPRTYNIDPLRVEEAITHRTKAVIPVHLYGQPADMGALLDIANRHNLWLIEDAAQAHLAEYDGQPCGGIGHLACFSFYPGKNLGAYGDAGAVTGNDQSLLDRVRRLRNHGRTTKYEHEDIGFGERLHSLQAAVLRAKLPYLRSWTEARRRHASTYDALLSGCEVVLPWVSPKAYHVYHLYVVRLPRRDAALSHLTSRGVGAGIHYPLPLHRQPAYLKLGYGRLSLPVAERAAEEVLSLPLYPELTEGQIRLVVDCLKEALGR